MKKMYCRLAFLMLEKDTKLSQRQLSRELGISLGTINKLYNGRPFTGRVDSEVVEKLCHYFQCGLSDLFELRDDLAEKLSP
jgi:putative transcriptional regulator